MNFVSILGSAFGMSNKGNIKWNLKLYFLVTLYDIR